MKTSVCYQSPTERRANVERMARERHPESPCLAALLLAWSEAESAAKRPALTPQERAQADRSATAAMHEYLRVKALPLLFPFAVFVPEEPITIPYTLVVPTERSLSRANTEPRIG